MPDTLFPSAPNKTDITAAAVVSKQLGDDPAQYFTGRVRLPSWVFKKPHRAFVYGDSIQIASNTSGRLDINLDADSYFIVDGIVIQSSQQLTSFDDLLTTVQIIDSTYGQPWSNAPVPIRDIAGTGANVKILPYPSIARPTATLSFLLANNATQTQTYYCAFIGRKVYNMSDAEASYLSQRGFYQYVMSVPAISSGVSGQVVNMQVLGSQDFLLKNICGSQMLEAMSAAGSNAGTNVIGQLRDTTNDYYFFNQKLYLRLWLGGQVTRLVNQTVGGQLYKTYSYSKPFSLGKPVYMRANAILEGNFDNSGNDLSAAAITFEGARIFPGAYDTGADALLSAPAGQGAGV